MNDAFLYYRSFYEATKQFPAEDRLAAHEAIMEYALYGTEPEITGAAYAIFLMAKPQIDANAKRRKAGRAGGEAKRDNAEANRSKSKAKPSKREANKSNASESDVANSSNATNVDVANSSNATQNDVAQLDKYKEKENEKDKENYKEKAKLKEKNTKEKESDALAERSFSEPVKEALTDWLQYKREKGQSYKPTGLKQLFDGIETEINNRGEPAVIEGIENSMRNNYQGIYYPRPQPKKVEVFDADAYLRERMMTG